MKYCSNCGAPVRLSIPRGDDRPRFTCDACRTIHYQNPKVVVGCIPEWEDRLLLCRRAIEPRYGKWTLPAGFLENAETISEGARREAFEEAQARVDRLIPYALFNLTFINQIYVMFRSVLSDPNVGPGHESLEVKLFREEEIPWDELAFPVVRESLVLFLRDRAAGIYRFYMGDILPSGKLGTLATY